MKEKTGKKRMKLLIAAVCVLALGAGGLGVSRYLKSRIMDGPGMVNEAAVMELYYYHGQDEYGQAESMSLKNSQLTFDENGGTVNPSVRTTAEADETFYNELEDIVRKYSLWNWAKLPESELEVLDGPTTTLKITFASNAVVELGSDVEMPEGAWAAVKEITDLMESRRES